MNEKNKYQVAVIGGGPAGACASTLLSKNGIKVILFEKERFPREKIGESLIPHFWKFTDAMGVSEKITNEGFIKKAGGLIFWDNVFRTISFKDFGFERPALHVEREVFDKILLDHSEESGTEIQYESTVKSVHFNKQGVSVSWIDKDNAKRLTNINYVIDASGQSAVVAKQYGLLKFNENFKFQAYWGYYDKSFYLNARGEITDFEHRYNDHPETFIYSTGDWGWFWHIPLREKVSVGLLVPRSKLKSFNEGGSNLKQRFQQAIEETPAMRKLLCDSMLLSKIRTVKDYAFASSQFVYNNCFLSGDAAAFFDPINSEGVTMAMYGGYIAAWAIQKSLINPKRKDFYKAMYINQLQLRFELFNLLTVPDELVSKDNYKSIKKCLLNQSVNENYLALTQLMVTQRGKDFPELLKSIGLNPKGIYGELQLHTELCK